MASHISDLWVLSHPCMPRTSPTRSLCRSGQYAVGLSSLAFSWGPMSLAFLQRLGCTNFTATSGPLYRPGLSAQLFLGHLLWSLLTCQPHRGNLEDPPSHSPADFPTTAPAELGKAPPPYRLPCVPSVGGRLGASLDFTELGFTPWSHSGAG